MTSFNPSRRKFLKELSVGTLITISPIIFPNIANALEYVIDYWKPYEYINESGKADGAAVKIMQEVESRINQKFPDKINFLKTTFIEMPWKRGLREIKNGSYDGIFSGNFNQERENDYYIPDTPIGYSTWQAYKLKNKFIPKSFPLLGKVNGYYYPPDLISKVKKRFANLKDSDPIPKNEYMYLMLLRERVNIAIFEKSNLEKILKDLNEPNNLLEPIPETKFYTPLFPFFSKKLPFEDFKLIEETLKELQDENFIENTLKENNLPYFPNIPKTGEFAHLIE